MAKKSKKKEQSEFEAKLAELAEAYGIVPADIAVTQIVDLAEDLSEVSLSDVFRLVMDTAEYINAEYAKYNKTANIIIDGKIRNAIKSFESASPEMAIMFMRMVLVQYRIKLKRPEFLEEYQDYAGPMLY